jgi:hypothetical protein
LKVKGKMDGHKYRKIISLILNPFAILWQAKASYFMLKHLLQI